MIGAAALAAHGAAIFAGRRSRRAALRRAAAALHALQARVPRRAAAARTRARDALDVAKLDDALIVQTGTRRRAIPLPRKLAQLALVGAKLEAGMLIVRLAPAERSRLMRVVLLTGKGGVGKTTLAAATAIGAAEHGHRVFLLSTDPAHSVGDALGRPVGARPVRGRAERGRAGSRRARRDRRARGRRSRTGCAQLLREGADELLAEEVLVFPGLEELVALRAIREVEALGDFDVCVVDCAPTGATLRMLRFPDALAVFMGASST